MAIDVTQKRVNTLELDTHLCDSGAENQPFSDDSEVIALRAQSTVTHYKKKDISQSYYSVSSQYTWHYQITTHAMQSCT